MLNSTEEHSYWYLRLNGFFLLDNFVIHKSSEVDYTSDADLLAIRTPFVYEEIGGQEKDWDKNLLNLFNSKALIGIVCQVKGGAIIAEKLFRGPYLSYSLQRLGLTAQIGEIIEQLTKRPIATFQNELGQLCQIGKLLITRDLIKNETNFIQISLDDVYAFLQQRIKDYPKEKYRDRIFFSSIGFQTLIEINESEYRRKKNIS